MWVYGTNSSAINEDGKSPGKRRRMLGEEKEAWFGLGYFAARGTGPCLCVKQVSLKARKTSQEKLGIAFRTPSEITVEAPLRYNHDGMSTKVAFHTVSTQVRKLSSEYWVVRPASASTQAASHSFQNLTTIQNISAPAQKVKPKTLESKMDFRQSNTRSYSRSVFGAYLATVILHSPLPVEFVEHLRVQQAECKLPLGHPVLRVTWNREHIKDGR